MFKLTLAAAIFAIVGLAAADAPRRPHRAPPPEAIEACANAKQADECSFKIHDHQIAGTCQPRPDDTSQLACRPNRPPPPPPGGGSGDPPPPPPQSSSAR